MIQKVLYSGLLLIFLTGCGEGFDVKSLEGDVKTSIGEVTEIEKATLTDMQSIESDIADLESVTFDEYNNPGLSLSKIKALKSSLGSKLDDIVKKIEAFKLKISELRSKINDYIAILDPNDPNQQQIIERLQELLLKLDQIEQKIDMLIDIIKTKLDFIDQIFDELIARLDPSNPMHMFIRIAIEAIRGMIKAKLGI